MEKPVSSFRAERKYYNDEIQRILLVAQIFSARSGVVGDYIAGIDPEFLLNRPENQTDLIFINDYFEGGYR